MVQCKFEKFQILIHYEYKINKVHMYDCVLMQCLEYVKYSPVIQINNCMHNIFFTKNSIHYINKMHMQIKIEIVNPSLRNSTFNFLVLDTSRMRF